MKDWKIRLEEKLKKSVVELTGIIRYVIYKMINDYFNAKHSLLYHFFFFYKNF